MPTYTISVEAELETGRIAAVYLKFRDGKSAKTREYDDGNAFADFDKQGRLLGIELLAPCNAATLERIIRGQPKHDKQLVRQSVPTGMVAAG